MQFYPKDQDPRLDERSARFHGRVLKEDLATLPFVLNTCNRDINVARATNHVTWDYGKDMWVEVDHLMMNFYIQAKTSETREELEDKINRGVVELIKGPRYYEQAKVYCMIDMNYPEDESIYDIVKVPKKDPVEVITLIYQVRTWRRHNGNFYGSEWFRNVSRGSYCNGCDRTCRALYNQ